MISPARSNSRVQESRKSPRSCFRLALMTIVLLMMGVKVMFSPVKILSVEEWKPAASPVSSSDPSQAKRKKKLADGCLHVFLDAGANKGIHTRFLFEPERYPLATTAKKVFETFGSYDNRDVCSFGFEPNPFHRSRQKALQEAYAAQGWRYTPLEVGLGDVHGEPKLHFYHNDAPGVKSEVGFSIVNRGNLTKRRKEEVPILHFANWVENEIMDRQYPERIYGTYPKINGTVPGKVVLKMDTEGMEFYIVPSLLFSGVMCKAIDAVFGEYHDAGYIPAREPMVDDGSRKGELARFANWIAARDYWNTLWKAMTSINPDDCRTRWLDFPDEEHYRDDGVPLPNRTNVARRIRR